MSEELLSPMREQTGWPMMLTPMRETSLSSPYELLFQPVERPAFTEMTTKIDALAVPHLVPFLHAHGATVEAMGGNQLYRARLPSGKQRMRTFKVYRVTFPEGLRRLDGPCTRWLVPFTLIFPDGARLDGRINTLPHPEEVVLGLPVPSRCTTPARRPTLPL